MKNDELLGLGVVVAIGLGAMALLSKSEEEIKLVRSKFSRLSRFVKYKRPLMWFGF